MQINFNFRKTNLLIPDDGSEQRRPRLVMKGNYHRGWG